MNVLIAEDDATSLRFAELTLRRLGHTCVTATDGTAAWETYRRGGIEVILSDWRMPGIEGPELCRRVRAAADSEPGRPYTYFILVTGLEDREHFLEGMRAGADDYLTKPMDPTYLEARLLVAKRVTQLHADLRDLNRRLWDLARRDPLTGLFNRLQLTEDLVSLRERAATGSMHSVTFSLAICDVDHFKRYNDQYGHIAGDAALCRVAGILAGVTVPAAAGDGERSVKAYRYGGEEFCLLLPVPVREAFRVLDTVRQRIRGLGIPHAGNETKAVLTLSIGLASFPAARGADDAIDVDAVLRAADDALYAAKEAGRDCVISLSLSSVTDT